MTSNCLIIFRDEEEDAAITVNVLCQVSKVHQHVETKHLFQATDSGMNCLSVSTYLNSDKLLPYCCSLNHKVMDSCGKPSPVFVHLHQGYGNKQ